jgi:hypothetical protein
MSPARPPETPFLFDRPLCCAVDREKVMPTNTSTPTTTSTPSTPKPDRTSRKRRHPALLAVGAIAAAGLLVGAGITVQGSAAEAERIATAEAASERLEQHQSDFDARAAARAEAVIAAAEPVISAAAGKADVTELAATVDALAEFPELSAGPIFDLVIDAEETIPVVKAQIAEADRIAAEKAAAEKAAAEAAALAAAAAKTPSGAQAIARDMMASKFGWGADQASCLINLWQKESGWRADALNASSGATGIPQALPGSKMASHGADWQTNPMTQIAWGLDYIKAVYGTPCGAWAKSQSVGWY